MSDHEPAKQLEKRSLRSPVNRMIDEGEEMQRDADPRHMIKPSACGKTDKGADDGADL